MSERHGLVMVFTGSGKGKTTAALGAAFRATGQGFKVLIIQFIKSSPSGELEAARHLPNLEIRQRGRGMIGPGPASEEDRQAARQAFEEARAAVLSGEWDMVIMDELCRALTKGLIELAEVLDIISNKPKSTHLIITGRACPEELIAAADLVTRMEEIKHHWHNKIKAQAGVEY